jgi:hypothetical protein
VRTSRRLSYASPVVGRPAHFVAPGAGDAGAVAVNRQPVLDGDHRSIDVPWMILAALEAIDQEMGTPDHGGYCPRLNPCVDRQPGDRTPDHEPSEQPRPLGTGRAGRPTGTRIDMFKSHVFPSER